MTVIGSLLERLVDVAVKRAKHLEAYFDAFTSGPQHDIIEALEVFKLAIGLTLQYCCELLRCHWPGAGLAACQCHAHGVLGCPAVCHE
jgi:hypothetical protein